MKESEKEMVAITSKAGRSAARLSRPDSPQQEIYNSGVYSFYRNISGGGGGGGSGGGGVGGGGGGRGGGGAWTTGGWGGGLAKLRRVTF